MKKMKNDYTYKFVRTITSMLPIKGNRHGLCKRCGECCKLLNTCAFLDYDRDNKAVCKLYKLRPLNCRKYPRSLKEHVTKEVCSYHFEDG